MLRWIALILIALLIGLQIKLWVGDGGMRDLRAIRERVSGQQAENAKLKQRNDALGADVEDLKHGQDAVEARARSQLGLIKPGEVFYQVVATPGGSSTAAPPPATATMPSGSRAATPSPATTAPPSPAANAAPASEHDR